MAKIKGLTLTETAVFQRINLSNYFKQDLTGNDAVKEAIAGKVIDLIVERTLSGKDVNGGRLKSPYSESYANSLEFKAWGKSKGKVNMKLTGDMLGSLEVIDMTDNEIIIGWTDDIENAKAYNHNTGDTLPKREFFGITEDEFRNKIASEFIDILGESNALSSERQQEVDQLMKSIQSPSLPSFGLDNA